MCTGIPDMAAQKYAARIASGDSVRLPESHSLMQPAVTPIMRANTAGGAWERARHS
jgi:hypothetical protein